MVPTPARKMCLVDIGEKKKDTLQEFTLQFILIWADIRLGMGIEMGI